MKKLLILIATVATLTSCTKDHEELQATTTPTPVTQDTVLITGSWVKPTPYYQPNVNGYFFHYLKFNKKLQEPLTCKVVYTYFLSNNPNTMIKDSSTYTVPAGYSEVDTNIDRVCYTAGTPPNIQAIVTSVIVPSIYGQNTFVH